MARGTNEGNDERLMSDITATPKKKKRRVFMWVFLVIQALFIVWIIAGVGGQDTSDCVGAGAQTCKDATAVGTGIGVFFIVVFWCIVDFLLGMGYLVYRVARRP